jgi:hypothetical protein
MVKPVVMGDRQNVSMEVQLLFGPFFKRINISI